MAKKFWVVSLSLVMVIGAGILVQPYRANAQTCDTDCKEEAKFEYPCPTPRNLGRKCKGINPARLAACEVGKQADCARHTLENNKDRLVKEMANAVASDPNIVTQAKGWTSGECRVVGYGAITATILLYSQPICTLIAPGVGNYACATALGAAETAIVEATCAQLCTDKHLSDCQ